MKGKRFSFFAAAVSAVLVLTFVPTASAQESGDGAGGPPDSAGFFTQPPNFPFGQNGFFPPAFTPGFFGESPPPPFTEGFFANLSAPPFQAGFLPPPFAAFFAAQDSGNGTTNGDGTVQPQMISQSRFGR